LAGGGTVEWGTTRIFEDRKKNRKKKKKRNLVIHKGLEKGCTKERRTPQAFKGSELLRWSHGLQKVEESASTSEELANGLSNEGKSTPWGNWGEGDQVGEKVVGRGLEHIADG